MDTSATSIRRCMPGPRGASTRSSRSAAAATRDRAFLERVFHKLLLNFTWWVNRKDAAGQATSSRAASSGLDNIGVFDRSEPLPTGGYHRTGRRHRLDGHVLPQPAAHRAGAGAARLRLRRHGQQVLRAFPLHRRRHEPHGRRRRRACGTRRTASSTTCCTCPTAARMPLKVRSMVGLIPLFAVETLEPRRHRAVPRFQAPHASGSSTTAPTSPSNVASMTAPRQGRAPPALTRRSRPSSAASSSACSTRTSSSRPYGIRSLSRAHQDHPVSCSRRRRPSHRVDYEPGESDQRHLRRQLQLARPGLVPAQLPDHRIAAEVPPLLGRRLQGRMSHRLRPDADAVGSGRRNLAPPLAHLLRRRHRRPPSRQRRQRVFPRRPALARPDCSSTNTSTATPAPAWAPATRPAGPAWWPSCCSRSREYEAPAHPAVGRDFAVKATR